MTLDLGFFPLLQLAVQSPQGQDVRLWEPLMAKVKRMDVGLDPTSFSEGANSVCCDVLVCR